MLRREFLFGSFGAIVYLACGSDDKPPAGPATGIGPDGGPTTNPDGSVDSKGPPGATSSLADSDKVFPQGVVSGDPRPDRVVIWTRVDPAGAGKAETDDIDIDVIVARDEALTDLVGRVTVKALAADDHTIRLVPTGLAPAKHYYYRFELHGVATTQIGRTKTAPDPTADVPVKFVMAACQDYIGRYWHAWKAFLDEKVDVDFVLYLGDYIYESVNDERFQSAGGPDGGASDRAITLPDGLDTSPKQDKSRIAAGTLADYRTLYKTYRKDPILKEVHRLFPFIITWDDHEFADDCWQDHSTSFNGQDPKNPGNPLPGDEKNTARRTAANHAFFDYQPVDVVYKPKLQYPFDIKIYRQLKYGKHVDLFLTDQRSYRSDHVIPEGQGADTSVGKFTDYSSVGSRYFVKKNGFDVKELAAKPTLLGTEQKAWFLEAVKASTATWKVWCNEVQLYQMLLDIKRLPGVPDLIAYTVYLNCDQWDGYRTERAEILSAFEGKVENLLVCTGDIHSFYAAELHSDFDAPKAKPVGVEYVTAGISSASLKELMAKFVPEDSPFHFVIKSWTGAADKAVMDSSAPYLRYADTDSYGFALMSIDGTKVEATFCQVGSPKDPKYVGVTERKKFTTAAGTNKIVPA